MRIQDQTGRWIDITTSERIVSLVPSQTELLYDLGLGEKVVGITKFCVHPKDLRRSKKMIGGTKTLKHDQIDLLNPDLIIANKEENSKEDVELLIMKYPVYISDIYCLNDALVMIRDIGKITGTQGKAEAIVEEIVQERSVYSSKNAEKGDVAYLIWNNPIMIAGRNTFINSMLEEGGWTNAFEHLDRYPEIETADLIAANPAFVFLSSEPFPFKEKHIKELKEILPQSKILLVDGELFSWYGSRLKHAFQYLNELY